MSVICCYGEGHDRHFREGICLGETFEPWAMALGKIEQSRTIICGDPGRIGPDCQDLSFRQTLLTEQAIIHRGETTVKNQTTTDTCC